MFAIFCIAVQYFKSKYCSNNRVCRQYSYDGTRFRITCKRRSSRYYGIEDHQEKNTDTENTNSDKEQGTEESTDSDKIVTAYV